MRVPKIVKKLIIGVALLLVLAFVVWRIFSPSVNGISVPPSSGLAKTLSTATAGKNVLVNTYDNKSSKYSIKYPANWEYTTPSKGTVLLSGKQGSPTFATTVNIQTILSKKTGGQYADLNEFMNNLKKQFLEQAPDTKFLKEDNITLKQANGDKIEGKYVVVTYTYKDQVFKQWQVVTQRADGLVFYAWAYTAPIDLYETAISIAKAMFKTWSIY